MEPLAIGCIVGFILFGGFFALAYMRGKTIRFQTTPGASDPTELIN